MGDTNEGRDGMGAGRAGLPEREAACRLGSSIVKTASLKKLGGEATVLRLQRDTMQHPVWRFMRIANRQHIGFSRRGMELGLAQCIGCRPSKNS